MHGVEKVLTSRVWSNPTSVLTFVEGIVAKGRVIVQPGLIANRECPFFFTLTSSQQALCLRSVNSIFPLMVVDKGIGSIMTKQYSWIENVIQDLEEFCRMNGMHASATEFARLRAKLEHDWRSKENDCRREPQLWQQNFNVH